MAIIRIQGQREKEQHVCYLVDTSATPLGVGGMGQVFRGRRIEELTGVETEVAVKFLFDDLNEAAIERSRREAAVQIDNENLVKMYGFIQIDEHTPSGVHSRYHVVSELLNGVMLLDLLNGKLTDSDGVEVRFARELYEKYQHDRYNFAIFIVKNMLAGVMALHDKGFIHRDIDPSNVMITSDGKVKIIDFGIAKQIDALSSDRHLTSTGQFMGKAAYAAPELVRGDVSHQNETTDIYAVGIVLFELIVGKLPFDGAINDVLDMQLHKKLPLDAIQSKQARKVISKATAKKQAERFLSAAEFRVAVEQLERDPRTNPGMRVSVDPESGLKKLMGNRKAVFSAAAAVILAVVVSIVSLSGGKDEMPEPEMSQTELAQMRAVKQQEIIDDDKPLSIVDSLTGVTVKSAGLLIDEALEMMKDEASVNKAMAQLDRVIANGKKSSARAAYIKGVIYLKNGKVPESLQSHKNVAQMVITPDDSIAHTYYIKAERMNPAYYPALFELGTDYNNGALRGIAAVDEAKARSYFEKTIKYAREAGDNEYVERSNKALEL